MSIFRNVVLNPQTEEECERAINLYKEQLSSLTNSGVLDAYICRLSKESILFFGISKRFGSVGISSFPIPYKRCEKSKFSEVDWIPGGLLLIRKKDCLDYDYFNLPGKAYCEDLIHSQLLKNKGVRLFISNTCSYYTKVAKYKDLGLIYFFSYIKSDFIARNYYRKIIKNPFLPMLSTYFFIINYYFFYKLVKLIVRTLNIAKKLFIIKNKNKIYFGD